jgi:hypothetical protein
MSAVGAQAATCESKSQDELKRILANLHGLEIQVVANNSDEVKIKCLGTLKTKTSEYGIVFYSHRFLVNPETEVSHISRDLLVFDSQMKLLGEYDPDDEDRIEIKGDSIQFPKTRDKKCHSGSKITFTTKGPPLSEIVNCSYAGFVPYVETRK